MRYISIIIIQFLSLTSIFAQNRNSVSTIYDEIGRIKEEIYYDSIRVRFQYDETGNRLSRTVECVRLKQSQRRDTICEGDALRIGQNRYTQTGSYRDTFRFMTKCDSVVQTNLFVKRIERTQKDTSICNGDTLRVGANTYTVANTYRDTFASINTNTCFVENTTRLLVNPIFERMANICEGNSYNFYGQVLTNAGFYKKRFVSNRGCDSIVSLNLRVIRPQRRVFDTVLCRGQVLELGSRFFNVAGTDSVLLRSQNQCDSIMLVFNLRFQALETRDTIITLCSGDSLRFGNMVLRQTGIFTQTFRSVYGCDSIVRVNLRVLPRPALSFIANIDSSRTVRFTNQSTNVSSFIWHFGDGQTSNIVNPIHTYANNGNYSIRLVALGDVCSNDTLTQNIEVPLCNHKGAVNVAHATCGQNNGRIWTIESGAIILWNNQRDSTFGNLAPNIYPIKIAVGACHYLDTIEIRLMSPAVRSTIIVNNDGSVVARPISGTPPFSFRWQDGSTDSIRFGLRRDSIRVLIIDRNNCKDSSQIFYNSTISIEKLSYFSAYPNPTIGYLFIKGSFSSLTTFECLILDDTGRSVWQSRPDVAKEFSFEVNLLNKANGIYYFLLKEGDNINTYPFIIQN